VLQILFIMLLQLTFLRALPIPPEEMDDAPPAPPFEVVSLSQLLETEVGRFMCNCTKPPQPRAKGVNFIVTKVPLQTH
jgi:hypothetical protein